LGPRLFPVGELALGGVLPLLGEHHPLVLAEVGDEVPGVEEGVLAQTDVDERRLHPGEDVGDDSLVDVPDDRTVPATFEEQLGEQAPVDDGDPRLADSGVDDDLTCHRSWAPAPFAGARATTIEWKSGGGG